MPVSEIVVGREPEDVEKYGSSGCAYIGKHIVGKGEDAHLTNKVLMDVVRPHVVLVVGKRGCVTGDTLVFTDKGYKPIEKFDPSKDKVYSWNSETNSFEWAEANLIKYPVNEELFKVELQDGRKILMTNDHPLLAFENGTMKWKKAEEMKVDDRLIVSLKIPEVSNDKENIRIARLLGFILADGTIYVKTGRWKDGRGHWYNGTIKRLRIFNANQNVLKQAKEDLEKEFGIKVRIDRRKTKDMVLQTKQSWVVDKFIELGVPIGSKADKIRVPKIVFESSNNFKANFLNALFSCDRYVNKHGMLVYYSKSKKFLEGIQLLLGHFSILSTLKSKIVKLSERKFLNYALYVIDHLSIENFKKIGLFHDKKNERLQNHVFKKYKMKKRIKFFTQELAGVKIQKINKINWVEEVYDLTVPKTHSFLANGIISHNTGKSYTGAVMAEEIMSLPEDVKQNLSCLLIDTMGNFWSMKSPNEKDLPLLSEWGIKPKGFAIQNIVPIGLAAAYEKAGIGYDGLFAIKPSLLSSGDWALTFGLSLQEPLGILLERIIKKLKSEGDYGIEEIIGAIEQDKRSEEKDKLALENRFLAAKEWGIFSQQATPVEQFLKPGVATVLDISLQEWNVRNLMLGILSREIYEARTFARREEEIALIGGESVKKIPMTWIIMDEAHNFIPAEGETAATHSLLTLVTQGRQPGISCVFITQRPNKLHETVIAQSDLIISHRLTAKPDLDALSSIMQTYLLSDIRKSISDLPRGKGAALVLDDNSERLYNIQVRPRQSWHAGGSPIALKEK